MKTTPKMKTTAKMNTIPKMKTKPKKEDDLKNRNDKKITSLITHQIQEWIGLKYHQTHWKLKGNIVFHLIRGPKFTKFRRGGSDLVKRHFLSKPSLILLTLKENNLATFS